MAGSSLKSVKPAGKRKMSRFNTDIVYFDLETTGFHSDAHILQIAATNYENAFNVYVKTKRPIDERASQHHGLRMVDGNLYLRNKLVKAYKIDQALSLFLEFLLIGCEPPVLLVAHNGNRFDAPRLVRAIVNNNMVSDFYMIEGFSDTLGIFKKKLPNRKGRGKFKLETLVKEFLGPLEDSSFHDARYDVEVLEKLVYKLDVQKMLFDDVKTFNTYEVKEREKMAEEEKD